jgi:hypothetical protein
MTEQMHIIDNKRVLMTDDEWKMYESICKSLDEPPHQKGKDFFFNLFESDGQGMITYLRPPTRTCTHEVFLFMMSLMVHQRMRDCYKQVNVMQKKMDDHMASLNRQFAEKMAELDKAKESK